MGNNFIVHSVPEIASSFWYQTQSASISKPVPMQRERFGCHCLATETLSVYIYITYNYVCTQIFNLLLLSHILKNKCMHYVWTINIRYYSSCIRECKESCYFPYEPSETSRVYKRRGQAACSLVATHHCWSAHHLSCTVKLSRTRRQYDVLTRRFLLHNT